jgi:hypothetical protein
MNGVHGGAPDSAAIPARSTISSVDRTRAMFSRDDELAGNLAHAVDEVGADAGTEGRCRFDFTAWNLDHFRYRIDHDANVVSEIVLADFDDDDAAALADLALGMSEAGRRGRSPAPRNRAG